MKRLLLLPLLILLAACQPDEQQIRNAYTVLGPGCTIYNVGSYGSISNLVVVRCENKSVTSSNYIIHHGKTSSTYSNVEIEG